MTADVTAVLPKVLVIDDDALVLRSTRMLLEACGFRVVALDRGDVAVETARREQPDVLLLDVMMPDIDGWETLHRLHADPDTSGIPVVIFTAREHARGRRLARELGAVDYVQKPFEPQAFVDLLRGYAARRRHA